MRSSTHYALQHVILLNLLSLLCCDAIVWLVLLQPSINDGNVLFHGQELFDIAAVKESKLFLKLLVYTMRFELLVNC